VALWISKFRFAPLAPGALLEARRLVRAVLKTWLIADACFAAGISFFPFYRTVRVNVVVCGVSVPDVPVTVTV
jgi:hypothetical protein